MAATVEAGSEHPLARAVLEYADSRLGTAPGRRGSLDAELGAALGEGDGWDQEGDQVPLSVRLPSREGKPAPAWQLPAKDSESHAGAACRGLPVQRRALRLVLVLVDLQGSRGSKPWQKGWRDVVITCVFSARCIAEHLAPGPHAPS